MVQTVFINTTTQLEEGSIATDYTKHKSNKTEVLLSEPLRGVMSSKVKDRIIKRNGQWVVERNYGKLVLDGYNTEPITIDGNSNRRETHIMFRIKPTLISKTEVGNRMPNSIISDRFSTVTPEQVWGWENLFINNINYKDIDMKLNGSDAYKADIYKTVIKFEAEQK